MGSTTTFDRQLVQRVAALGSALTGAGEAVSRFRRSAQKFGLSKATGKNANWYPRQMQDRSRYRPHQGGAECQRRRPK